MNARKASKMSDKYEDPQDVKGILKHIKDMARLGFTNTNVHLYLPDEKVKNIQLKLTKLGYDTHLEVHEERSMLSLMW